MHKNLLPVLLLCGACRSALARNEPAEPFIVEDDVLIETRDGTPIAAVIVRSIATSRRQPTALMYTICRSDSDVDVSDESIADAGEPLEILWHSESYIDVPLWQE